jgi:hypothetical protein
VSDFQITNPADDGKAKAEIEFKMMNQQLEYDYFKIVALSVIIGQPKFFVD